MSEQEPKVCTTSGEPVDKVRAEQTEETGQHKAYVILCEEERAKGFVRPYRHSYRHVGPPGPTYPLTDVADGPWDEESKKGFLEFGYVKWEAYPKGSADNPDGTRSGRLWTQAQLDAVGHGCGHITSMSRDIAETYARNPGFYGATFCCGCNRHLPVGKDGEFVWVADGERVGT